MSLPSGSERDRPESPWSGPLRLALVVQRYGEGVDGGAEYHCRLVAEHLARRHRVEVVTSCARDYITWRNELPAGVDRVNGIHVHRFKVRRPRDPDRFGRLSDKVLRRSHQESDELDWLREQGPYSPALIRYLKRSRRRYDYYVFFSYRYYHSYYGVRHLADRALLVPTAERDDVLKLGIFRQLLHLPRAIVYNSHEEREMIWEVTGNRAVRGDVVGVGSEVPTRIVPERFRRKYDLRGRYAIFIGRVDENKGCRELFHFFERYHRESSTGLQLVLIGGRTMKVPEQPYFRYLGFVNEEDKWDGLAGAELLVMPSELESLSMVTLEAWSVGRPVLANGRCEVLRGQCRRSNAGLYYTSYYEFREALALLERERTLREGLGQNGRRFYRRHYRWDVIESKYDRLLREVRSEDEARGAGTGLDGGFWARWFPGAVRVGAR